MMTIDIIGDDTVALQRVITGQDDYDFHQIPPDRLASTQQKYGDQIKVYTPANTYYFFMNNRVAPFDNLKVRQAVNYAINREALVRIYGGLGTADGERAAADLSAVQEAQHCTRTTWRRRSS